MTVGFWHRLDQTGRNMLPFITTVLLMLLSMTPVPIDGFSDVVPPLALTAIVYWAIHRPDLLRPSIVFLLGVLQDLLSGHPLGLTALLFTICYWILLTQRRFFLGNSFGVLWFGFSVLVAGAAVLEWVVFCLIHATILDIRPAVFQSLMAMTVFPLLTWLQMQVHRTFLS